MAYDFDLTMANTSLQYVTEVRDMSTVTQSPQEIGAENRSVPEGCRTVVFSEMEFLPWDNPSNIVSAEVEAIAYDVKDIMIVILFVIGGPGNVINMAVFFKQGLKDRVNLCLFALSLADELYLIVTMCIHAEQVYRQFITDERYGPMFTFMTNNNLTALLGFVYVSLVLSAIIASERCLCVLSPLKFQALLRTKTMAVIIVVVYFVVLALYFIVSFRMHIGCIYDPVSGVRLKTVVLGEVYQKYKNLIDHVDGFVFGIGLPGFVMIVVVSTTIATAWRLRQIVSWRAEASSSISSREVALTKMLIGTSILFIACVFPFALTRFSWLFLPEMNSGRRNQNFYLTTFWINKILTYINASFNIFVYYAMGSRYRETFWELFSKKTRSDMVKHMVYQVPGPNEP